MLTRSFYRFKFGLASINTDISSFISFTWRIISFRRCITVLTISWCGICSLLSCMKFIPLIFLFFGNERYRPRLFDSLNLRFWNPTIGKPFKTRLDEHTTIAGIDRQSLVQNVYHIKITSHLH